MPYLLYGDSTGQHAIHLDSLESGFTIGRGSDSNLRLREDSAISRKHCLIFKNMANGDFFLRDLESSNGTFVNNKHLHGEEVRIENGDIIGLGSIAFTFKEDDTPPCEYSDTNTIILKVPVPDISSPEEAAFTDTAKLSLNSPIQDDDDDIFPVVEGFELIRILGGNNYSTTYVAFQSGLKRTVALKTFHTSDADAKWRSYFIESVQTAGAINHKNVVPFFDAGVAGDLCFAAMFYATGGSLRKKLDDAKTPLSEKTVVEQALMLVDALAQANEAGIIHANISPSNILYNEAGDPMLSDLGLAQWIADVFQEERTAFFGRATYMPPEQTLDRGMDWTCDQYSLGAVLFEMLVGAPPFKAPNSHALIQKHLREKIRFPAGGSISESLKKTIATMMAKKPEQRFPSWAELAQALKHRSKTKAKPKSKPKKSGKNIPLKQKPGPKLKKTGTVIPIVPKKRAVSLKRK